MKWMEQGNTVEVMKIAEWNRIFNVSFKSLFGDLASLVVAIGTQNPYEAGKALLSAFFTTVSKDNDKPAHRAYLLMYGAMRQGMLQLVMDSAHILREQNQVGYEASAFENIAKGLDEAIEKENIQISEDFFDAPEEHLFFRICKPKFHDWLLGQGLHPNIALQISRRLDFYYVRQIDALLAEEPDYFGLLKSKLERSEAQKRLWARHLYNQSIIADWNAPIFGESFGLAQIYVGLSGCYPTGDADSNNGKIPHKVVDAESHIWDWIQTSPPKYSTMVLRGGPGSGKSSLMKKIAKRLAEEDQQHFYLIPLQHFKFAQGLEMGIKDFIAGQVYLNGKEDPMQVSHQGSQRKAIFIFDGLDELSRTGKTGEAAARELTVAIKNFLSEYNAKGVEWDFRALITGRNLVVQQAAEAQHREQGQVLELLPYHILDQDREWRTYRFQDEGARLQADLRGLWWRQYWRAKGDDKTAMPDELQSNAYESLTCQPLLSYLLARAFSRGQLDDATRGNINLVYERLIGDVRTREWGGKGGYQHTDLRLQDFMRLLEELALTAWHSGDVRATTVSAFEKRCQDPEVKRFMQEFKAASGSDATDLMVSFFTRKVGINPAQDALIEFTHKSFGEYLVARRIVAMAVTVAEYHAKSGRHDQDTAISIWLELSTVEELTAEIWQFLRREVVLRYSHKQSEAAAIQQSLASLFSRLINDGIPLRLLDEKTNLDIIRATHHAEANLLLTISAFARASGENTNFAWRDRKHPKEVLSRILLGGGRLFGQGLEAVSFPEQVDLRRLDLAFANLDRVNLAGANLAGANLVSANLEYANLEYADLSYANLIFGQLSGANLSAANLTGADLTRADLRGADLTGANLTGANLTGANLTGAMIYPFRRGNAILDGPEAYNYLKSRGAINVPKPEGMA